MNIFDSMTPFSKKSEVFSFHSWQRTPPLSSVTVVPPTSSTVTPCNRPSTGSSTTARGVDGGSAKSFKSQRRKLMLWVYCWM